MDSLKCKIVPPLWRKVWHFLIKLNMPLFSGLVIPPLDLYQKNKNTYPQSFSHKWQKLETQIPSRGKWTNFLHSYSGILFSSKKYSNIHNNMNKSNRCYAEQNKLNIKGYTVPFIWRTILDKTKSTVLKIRKVFASV